MRRVLPLVLGLVTWLSPVLTFAQAPPADSQTAGDAEARPSDMEARNLFQAGQLAFEDGRFADALDAFQRAHELSQRPALLYNIGLAADRLREDELALDAFQRFVAAMPDAPERSRVEARIAAIRQAIARREALSPQQVAQASMTAPTQAPPPADIEARPVWKSWWLWTAVGVVAAGTVLSVVLATRDPGVEPPLEGDVGFVIRTLVQR